MGRLGCGAPEPPDAVAGMLPLPMVLETGHQPLVCVGSARLSDSSGLWRSSNTAGGKERQGERGGTHLEPPRRRKLGFSALLLTMSLV